MPEVLLTLAESRPETTEVRRFRFTPNPAVAHRAGQYLMLRMEAPGDARGPSRTFTIASSPTEPGGFLIATRITASVFKQRLASLPVGTQLKARAPIGTFTLPDVDGQTLVFLAGGIGATPFRAMARYAADGGLRHEILLLHACRVPEEIVFRKDFEAIAARNLRFRVIVTITDPKESATVWSGPTGPIDADFLQRHVGLLDDAIVYAAGPPAIVDAMISAAASRGVPKERLRAERFTGY